MSDKGHRGHNAGRWDRDERVDDRSESARRGRREVQDRKWHWVEPDDTEEDAELDD